MSTSQPRITNLVFDFGGVLFQWQPARLFEQHLPQHASTPVQARQLAHAMFLHPDWEAFDQGMVSLEHAVERSATRLQLPHADLHTLVASIADHLSPLEDTVALLTGLHQRRSGAGAASAPKLYYLSNMPAPYARQLEQKHGFLNCFDGGVFSGDAKLIKPQPAIYEHLETRYALQPAQTLFIDDLAANIKAARSRGWHGIQFESAQQLARDLRALGV